MATAGKASAAERPNRWDLLVIAAVLVCAFLATLTFWTAPAGDGLTAHIALDGAEIRTIDLAHLSQPLEFTVEGDHSATVRAERGRICVLASDCPGEDCVHSGWADKAGQSLVCLPGRMSIRLVGGDPGYDLIVG